MTLIATNLFLKVVISIRVAVLSLRARKKLLALIGVKELLLSCLLIE